MSVLLKSKTGTSGCPRHGVRPEGRVASSSSPIRGEIGEADLHSAGWNVFCNGRLVLASDQEETTGWGADRPVKIPKYHSRFDRFHGFRILRLQR